VELHNSLVGWGRVASLFCSHEGVSITITGSPDGGLKYGIVRISSGAGPSASNFLRALSV
jgi:hypothetical protein